MDTKHKALTMYPALSKVLTGHKKLNTQVIVIDSNKCIISQNPSSQNIDVYLDIHMFKCVHMKMYICDRYVYRFLHKDAVYIKEVYNDFKTK